MTQEELARLIKGEETPYGILVLAGEEGYLIRHYLNLLRKRLIPDEKLISSQQD